MIKLENVVLASPEQMEFIIEGMRNPMNSWEKSDSTIVKTDHEVDDYIDIGKTDYLLMQRLSNAGTDRRNFMRMMPVYVRITAPLYWWKDFDDLPAAYTIGVISDNSNVIDKIHDKEFTLEDFSCDQLSTGFEEGDDFINSFIVMSDGDSAHDYELYPRGVLEIVIEGLNKNRKMFLDTRNKKYWWQMIQLLPSSYNQTRNVMMNYEVLANIYRWRKDHKLDEWREFCKWIERLPYSELITHPSSPITQAGDIVGRLASAMAEISESKKKEKTENENE
jgi:hypothetical protein